MAALVYENGKLIAVEYVTNFLMTDTPPLDIILTEKWQWMLYIGALVLPVLFLVYPMYLPIFKRNRKEK